ncbi:helix-turn-helix transcriptional regulator [Pectobacterium aroidearum]|uniref:XRE family transcriptional regulator n=1 Tax=Pectobacterium TaxID=122277 RepID=UPI00202D8E14|nr:helix-turn-helix transcriptional regulator [Pectobacterium brasiliense]MCL6375927.1 XRE family transcriptional regulator [Pectobacterium brasiliense]
MSYEDKERNDRNGSIVPIEVNTKGTTFAERLRIAIGDKSIRSFSTETGISYGAMHKYFAGMTQPTLDNLVTLSEKTGCSLEWLATGKKSTFEQSAVNVLDVMGNPVDIDEFAFIPRYDVRAAAGHGALNETETPKFPMAFRKYWIKNFLNADPHHLFVITVDGSSLEGTLNDGDNILVNGADTDPKEGIYVLRVDGHLLVKLVQRVPGGLLKVSSTNTAYEPFTVDMNNQPEDFAIIGRVVWFGRTI